MNYSPVQDGGPDITTDLWDDAGPGFYVKGTDKPAGLVFQLATGVTFTAISLTLYEESRVDVVGNGSWELHLVSSTAPAPWSQSNFPAVAGSTLVASLLEADYPVIVGPRTWTIGTAAVNSLAAQQTWTGRIALVLTFPPYATGTFSEFASMENADWLLRPVLETTEIPATTRRNSLIRLLPPRPALGGILP